jgi:hypothetical protein
VTDLIVEFAGTEIVVDRRLSFGRSADLELDVNQFMHRHVGEFFLEDGVWWLRNLGSRIHLILHSGDGAWVELPPKAVQVLTSSTGSVRFSAGPANYELTYTIGGLALPDGRPSDVVQDTMTTQMGLRLNPREVDYLLAFARPRLVGSDEPVPTYAQVADMWNVSVKTLDNTLQTLKRKLKDAGLARDEPLEAIVRIVVRHGLITRDDLDWSRLGSGESPRTSAEGPRFVR